MEANAFYDFGYLPYHIGAFLILFLPMVCIAKVRRFILTERDKDLARLPAIGIILPLLVGPSPPALQDFNNWSGWLIGLTLVGAFVIAVAIQWITMEGTFWLIQKIERK